MVEFILGKDEPVQMRESVDAFLDTSRPWEERQAALENLTMIVETIDNANSICQTMLCDF